MSSDASADGLGGETSQTMDRGLALLRLLTSGALPHGATVTQLAAELGVGRPVVYRLLGSLAREDYVARRADGRIVPGMGLLRLAGAVRPLVVERSVPILRRLADTVGATAHLTTAEQGEALAVAVVEPTTSDVHVAYRVGSRHPLESGAAGRAILLGREPGTNGAVFAATDGELQAGAHGLAAPIRGVPGVEASVGVVSLRALDRERVGPLVMAAADDIGQALA